MKSISKLLMATMLLSSSAFAQRMEVDGHRGGNGGNSIAGHFTTVAENIAKAWEDICSNEQERDADCNFIYDYRSLLNKKSHRYVTVKSQAQVFAYDDAEREAINDGVSNIIVSESKWSDMDRWYNPHNRRVKLVMHEFFSILGTDGSDYYAGSNKIMSIMGRKNYNMKRIASDQLLPDICSISVTGFYDSNIKDSLKDYLEKKNYDVKSAGEDSRYTMEVSSECTDKFFSRTCTLITEIKDNLKNDNIASVREIETDSESFRGRKKLLGNLLYRIMLKTKECKVVKD
jgi:hypothetical protein